MAWRLKHSTPKVWTADGVTPASVIKEAVMEIGEKAARQQLAFYLQGWLETDPDNRHVTQRDGLNAWCVERPPGCACETCIRTADASPNLAWWNYGSTGPHVSSYMRLKRLDTPTPRTAVETWRVVDRHLDANGQEEREFTLWSKHFTRAEAQKGLTAAVRRWRYDSRSKTAVRHSNSSYQLKLNSRTVAILALERIPS